MVEQFDNYIKQYEYDDESTNNNWFDYAFEYGTQLLNEFSQDDWDELKKELPSKSIIWQRRFVYCMVNSIGDNQLDILLSLTDTNDIYLFEIIIGILGSYDIEKIYNLDSVIRRIQYFYLKADIITEKVFLVFLKNVREYEKSKYLMGKNR